MGPGKRSVVVLLGCKNVSPSHGIVVFPDARELCEDECRSSGRSDVLTEELHQEMQS